MGLTIQYRACGYAQEPTVARGLAVLVRWVVVTLAPPLRGGATSPSPPQVCCTQPPNTRGVRRKQRVGVTSHMALAGNSYHTYLLIRLGASFLHQIDNEHHSACLFLFSLIENTVTGIFVKENQAIPTTLDCDYAFAVAISSLQEVEVSKLKLKWKKTFKCRVSSMRCVPVCAC